MRKTIALIFLAALPLLASCTYKTTFLVQDPRTGLPLYLISERKELMRKVTRGQSPEELGRQYFPNLKADDASVGVEMLVTKGRVKKTTLETRTLLTPQVTVSASAPRKDFQKALDRINEDFYERATDTAGVVKMDGD